jgi:hypothetical protein
MVNLAIEETSGVDHPAHLHEGWMVIKAANPSEVNEIVASLVKSDETTESSSTGLETEGNKEESMPDLTKDAEVAVEETVAPVAEETPADAPVAEEAAPVADEAPEAPAAEEAPASEDDVLKSAPEAVRNMVEALRKSADEASARATAAEAELVKSREAALDAEAVEKAKAWSHLSLDAEVLGKALRRLASVDADLAKSIEDVLSSVNAQAESANIFAEIGKSATPAEGGTALDRMSALAKSAVEAGEAKTFEQAFANVAGLNPDLYTQYLSEKAGA